MENKPPTKSPKAGIVLLILGIALVLIAQTMASEVENRNEEVVDNNTKKIVQYVGIGLLVIGGIALATSMSKKK